MDYENKSDATIRFFKRLRYDLIYPNPGATMIRRPGPVRSDCTFVLIRRREIAVFRPNENVRLVFNPGDEAIGRAGKRKHRVVPRL